jgi:ubiquinone/menaquinone biosynthesis C-methylase UbiE
MRREEDWASISAPFGDAVRAYYVSLGHDPQAANVMSSVHTNTDLVPGRGDVVLHLLRDLGGLADIEGRRVLEVGSGWGSLAAYLAWQGAPASLIGVDIREDFVAAARQALEQTPLQGVIEFRVEDLRELSEPDGGADVVVANNVLPYLADAGSLEAALGEVRRVLAPGGVFVAYQANRRSFRDPFTRAPLVHRMPPRLADAVCRATGWEHSHGRVRLVSPVALRRALLEAGFTEVRIGAPTSAGGTETGRGARLRSYFAVVAHMSEG